MRAKNILAVDLECQISGNIMFNPVTLPCGHNFESEALQQYHTEPAEHNVYNCPTCKTPRLPNVEYKPNLLLKQLIRLETEKKPIQLSDVYLPRKFSHILTNPEDTLFYLEVLKAKIDKKPDEAKALLTCQEFPNFSLLHLAAQFGKATVLAPLIALGCDKEAKTRDGATPMHVAARCGQIGAIIELGKLGADKEAKTLAGCTPMHVAAQCGQIGAINKLFELGANKGAKMPDGRTPMHLAAQCGHVEAIISLTKMIEGPQTLIIQYTIEPGPAGNTLTVLEVASDKDTKALDGRTPMHLAVANGKIAAVTALIDLKADINAACNTGETPLDLAIQSNQTAIIAKLREHKAKTKAELSAEPELKPATLKRKAESSNSSASGKDEVKGSEAPAPKDEDQEKEAPKKEGEKEAPEPGKKSRTASTLWPKPTEKPKDSGAPSKGPANR